jgi:uncharacterized membrane protein YqjE
LLIMLERSFALLVAIVCLVLLVRLVLPERHRWRLDAKTQAAWRACRDWARQAWRWRSSRQEAARIAEEAIERARKGVERDGNVFRPNAFKPTRGSRDSGEPRKPH